MTLAYDVQTRIGKLRTEFGDIVVQALKWLDHRYPETKDAVRWLNATLRGLQSEPLVVPSSSVSDNIPLDDQLQKKWSFTNPAILEGLVEKTNDRDLTERMKKYNENFKYVCRSIPISNQEIIFERFNHNKPSRIAGFVKLHFFCSWSSSGILSETLLLGTTSGSLCKPRKVALSHLTASLVSG